MEHTTKLDTPNYKGITPVQLLVKYGILNLTHLLLLNGANVNQKNPNGKTGLFN